MRSRIRRGHSSNLEARYNAPIPTSYNVLLFSVENHIQRCKTHANTELLHGSNKPKSVEQNLCSCNCNLLPTGTTDLCERSKEVRCPYCLRRIPASCISLQPNARRSSSRVAGTPSSREGVFSICEREASGYSEVDIVQLARW